MKHLLLFILELFLCSDEECTEESQENEMTLQTYTEGTETKLGYFLEQPKI